MSNHPTIDYPAPPAVPPQGKLQSEHDGFAIASLVTAFFLPILGIIFGHLSNHRAKQAHRAKSGLAVAGLVLGYLFTVISVLVIIIVAAAASSSPSASMTPAPPASSAPAASAPAAPAAQSYAHVQSLLAAMAQHGAACSNVSSNTSSTIAGSLSAADCSGVSAGDTVVAMFTDHASAVAYANSILGLGQSLGPVAEVVGPDWTVNTVPAFAHKVVTAVGGQLMLVPSASSPAPAAPATTAPAAPATSAPAAPAGPTTSQQQALDSAQSYLGLDSGFSRQGLIDQLDSPYGGKFSVADATWATDHSGADWDAQAVLAAKGYMNLGSGFSRSGLIDQLDSPYGGKFTLAQATYAVNQVGL